jgi:hypothetical protein
MLSIDSTHRIGNDVSLGHRKRGRCGLVVFLNIV